METFPDVLPEDQSPGHVAFLVVGDLLVLGGFLTYGLLSHGIDPRAYPEYAALSGIPFLLAWVAVAPLFGLYHDRGLRAISDTVFRTASAWIVIVLLAGAIRSTRFFHGSAPPTFLLVSIVFGLIMIVPWRVAALLVLRRVE